MRTLKRDKVPCAVGSFWTSTIWTSWGLTLAHVCASALMTPCCVHVLPPSSRPLAHTTYASLYSHTYSGVWGYWSSEMRAIEMPCIQMTHSTPFISASPIHST
jgi:hypothetical protein